MTADDPRGAPPRVPFGFLTAGLDRVSAGLNALGTLSLFGLMVLINSDVAGRGLFDQPVRGVPEITRIAIVAIVYLQLSHALVAGRMTRSDLLLTMIAQTRPRLAAALELSICLVGFALLATLTFAFVPEVAKAWSSGRFYGTRGGVTIPLWPLNAVIAVGLGATALQFLALAARQVGILRGRSAP